MTVLVVHMGEMRSACKIVVWKLERKTGVGVKIILKLILIGAECRLIWHWRF
jgi:predicted nucleotidyltransferase